MDWYAFFKTLMLCTISIIVEAISATKSGRQWFEKLRQPNFSPSLKTWYFVGAVYYVLFAIVGYRQFASGASFSSTTIILLAAMMLINGLSNFIVFKYQSLKWFYLIIYPFAVLLVSLIVLLWQDHDYISVILASLYFVWLLFDLNWAYNLWKLNERSN
jgi:tryptophan-rich sensory protein